MADVSGEEFERVNGINLRGVWNCMKYELRQMREQGRVSAEEYQASLEKD
jgi:NAD(P)-dependent dehydrogenase (short-subunit alcohol dehydrogenase family)